MRAWAGGRRGQTGAGSPKRGRTCNNVHHPRAGWLCLHAGQHRVRRGAASQQHLMPAEVARASHMLSGCSAQAAGWVAARSTCTAWARGREGRTMKTRSVVLRVRHTSRMLDQIAPCMSGRGCCPVVPTLRRSVGRRCTRQTVQRQRRRGARAQQQGLGAATPLCRVQQAAWRQARGGRAGRLRAHLVEGEKKKKEKERNLVEGEEAHAPG